MPWNNKLSLTILHCLVTPPSNLIPSLILLQKMAICHFGRWRDCTLSINDWLKWFLPFLIGVPTFGGLCSCCTMKPSSLSGGGHGNVSCSTDSASPESPTQLTQQQGHICNSDPRSTSVAELRRKAQEHSAALLQSLHAAAAAGLAFPGLHLSPLAFHHHHHHPHPALVSAHGHQGGIRLKSMAAEPQDLTATTINGLMSNLMPTVNLTESLPHSSSSPSSVPAANPQSSVASEATVSSNTTPTSYPHLQPLEQTQTQQPRLPSNDIPSSSHLSPPTTPAQKSKKDNLPLNYSNNELTPKSE